MSYKIKLLVFLNVLVLLKSSSGIFWRQNKSPELKNMTNESFD